MQVLRVLLKDPDGQADRWHLLAWEDGAFTLTPQPVPDLAYLLMREHHNFPYDAPYMSSQLLLSREGMAASWDWPWWKGALTPPEWTI